MRQQSEKHNKDKIALNKCIGLVTLQIVPQIFNERREFFFP